MNPANCKQSRGVGGFGVFTRHSQTAQQWRPYGQLGLTLMDSPSQIWPHGLLGVSAASACPGCADRWSPTMLCMIIPQDLADGQGKGQDSCNMYRFVCKQ